MIRIKLFAASLLVFLDIGIFQTNPLIKVNNKENKKNNIDNFVDNNNDNDNEMDNNANNMLKNENNDIDMIDNNDINFNDYNNDFKEIKRIPSSFNKDKIDIDKYNIINETKRSKKIHVSFAVDNNYIYPLIVLLTSILYNSSPKTIYSFHFLVPGDFLDINKKKIINLSKMYPYPKCELKFYNLKDKYIGWGIYGNYTQTVYYRLSLSDVVKDLDKIIYLDCDTMVHKDLTDFYNINMGNYYYMGFCGHDMTYRVFNNTRNFINSGVMLINLKELRKVNAPSQFEDYYYNYGTEKVDEYLINAVFYNKIKFLPFAYGIPDFEEPHDIIGSPTMFWNSLMGYCNGTIEELLSSSENRTITHGAYRDIKWWSRDYYNLTKIGKQWIYYASKSNVFNEICNTYKNYKKVCRILKQKKIRKKF